MMKDVFRVCRAQNFALVAVLTALSATASYALTLTGGPINSLTGGPGSVNVAAVDDAVTLDGALTSGGLVPNGLGISTRRVQYDVHNDTGSGIVFEYSVDYDPINPPLAATNPGRFVDAAGTLSSFWAGSNYSTLLDSGFGLYTMDATSFGSEWHIDYQPGRVTWFHLGNGFGPDTATGRTDVGNALPTFGLAFDPATPLGLQPANAVGIDALGAPMSWTGQTLSSVPEPGGISLLLLGLLLRLRRS